MFICKHDLLLVFCLFVINFRLLAQVTSSLLVCLHHKANNEEIHEIRPILLHKMSKQIDFLKKIAIGYILMSTVTNEYLHATFDL